MTNTLLLRFKHIQLILCGSRTKVSPYIFFMADCIFRSIWDRRIHFLVILKTDYCLCPWPVLHVSLQVMKTQSNRFFVGVFLASHGSNYSGGGGRSKQLPLMKSLF